MRKLNVEAPGSPIRNSKRAAANVQIIRTTTPGFDAREMQLNSSSWCSLLPHKFCLNPQTLALPVHNSFYRIAYDR